MKKKKFHDWAFNLPRGGKELREKWDMIPDDTQILVTHGPPKFHGFKKKITENKKLRGKKTIPRTDF